MIRKIPLSDHYYKESEIDDFLDEKSDKTHRHGDINKDGQITANASSVNKIAVTDSSNSIKTVDVLPLNKVTHQDISGKVNTGDIENNLTSNYTNRPLSAAQGKELKRLVDLKADSDTVYTKSQTMTVSEINQAIANGVGNIEIFEVVQELPTTNIKGNKFYLTPNGENIEKNVYDINIYVNNNWETIDSLEFDISNYPTTSEVTILLNGKVDIIEGKELSSNDFTDALKSKLENDVLTEHQSLVNYIQKSQTEGLVKNDGSIDTNQYLTEHQSLTNYIQKSQTQGLVKNDGTIDTNQYLTQHQSLTNYVQKSQVSGLIKNDGTIDSNQYLTEHQSLTNYVQKSLTSGLVKNDGTIDTNEYITEETAPKLFNYGFIDSNLVLHLMYLGTEISVTKTIMQSGDNNPITVVVSDEEGNLLEGMPVEFYINGVKVGQTTNTNSNGVATYTYQGIGSGEIEVQVKIGSFVSVPCNVLDTLMFDIATTGQKNNDDWHVPSGTLETPIPVDDNGAKLNNTGTGSVIYVANKHDTSPSGYDVEFPLDFAVEFDIVDSNNLGSCYLQIAPTTGTAYSPALNVNGSVIGSHHRIECTDGKVTVYIDNRTPVELVRSFSGLCSIRFNIGEGTYLKYKNFKVYSI